MRSRIDRRVNPFRTRGTNPFRAIRQFERLLSSAPKTTGTCGAAERVGSAGQLLLATIIYRPDKGEVTIVPAT